MFVRHYTVMLTKIIDCMSTIITQIFFFARKIYVTGTIPANQKGLPPLINKKKIVKMDRKQVYMHYISSTVVRVEITRHNQTRKVPQIVADYNKGMGGVDKSDQITNQYSSELKTVKS